MSLELRAELFYMLTLIALILDCTSELFKTDDVRESLKDRAPEEKDGIDQLEFPGFAK
jgi:hypothetical protein